MSELVDGTSDSSTRLNRAPAGLWPFLRYFLKLGVIGFGGPVALVGFMNRDLVERRGWLKEDVYQLGLALAQIMPGPLAAQLAIALGYFEHGILGATLGARLRTTLVSDGCRYFDPIRCLWRAVVGAGSLLWNWCFGHCRHRHCSIQTRPINQ